MKTSFYAEKIPGFFSKFRKNITHRVVRRENKAIICHSNVWGACLVAVTLCKSVENEDVKSKDVLVDGS